MKRNHPVGKTGIAAMLLIALTGCTTYVVQRSEPQRAYTPPLPAPAEVVEPAAPPPPPASAVVVIQRDDDFYQPLSPYGQWVVVDGYGRCWQPAQVEAGWRPYTNGHWELTDDGWYWASDEPWAWATYHYGRWELAANYGWIWVPETQWAPAWVSWREGGGYVGWAPLPPEPRGGVSVSVSIAPAAFCFVEESRMHDPVRSRSVIVNNPTVINKTIVITKTKVVNKVVINEGPRADDVEHVSGRKIEKVPVNDLRHKEEEPVAERHGNLRARPETHAQQPPAEKQPEPRKEVRPPEQPKPERAMPVVDKTPQEDAVQDRHPAMPPAPNEARPVEKPSHQAPQVVKTKDRQPVPQPQPEVQSPPPQPARDRATNKPEKQRKEPAPDKGKSAPKSKARGNQSGDTNSTDNSTQRDRK